MLSFTITPGYVFASQEKANNPKFNLLGQPTLTGTGGLENGQMQLGPYFYGTNLGAVNAYQLKLGATIQTPIDVGVDGTLVCFKPNATNTTTTPTLLILNSAGSTIFAARVIKKRYNTALAAGDLQAGAFYQVRYDQPNDCWQLVSPHQKVGYDTDLPPGQYWYATGSGTGTAYTLSTSPSGNPIVGTLIRLTVPADNTASGLTLNLNGAGAATVKKWDGAVLEPADLKTGMMVEMLYDGTNWILQSPGVTAKQLVAGTPLNSQNLALSRTSATTVQITADQMVVQNAAKAVHLLSAVNVSPVLNGASTGANALDTGTEAASTWYYLWVIWNSATNTVAGLLSTSSTAPTLPSGFDYKALAGCARNDGSSNIIDFWQIGHRVFFAAQTIFTAKTPGANNTYEALSGADLTALQAAVPPIARVLTGNAGSTNTANVGLMTVASDNTGLGANVIAITQTAATFDGFAAAAPVRVPMRSSQSINWKASKTAAEQYGLAVTGYEL